MSKTFIPPISQHIIPFTCTVNDELVVVLFEGNGAFDPESGPAHIEQVACDANCTVRKDKDV